MFRAHPHPLTPLLLAAALAQLASCGPLESGNGVPGEVPEGTVLLVAGQPVSAAEIDAPAADLARLDPAWALPHRRRIALLEIVLPLRIGRDLADGAQRAEARRLATKFLASQGDDSLGPPPRGASGWSELEREQGDFRSLGLPLWRVVEGLEPGVWSQVREVPGAFVVARVEARSASPRPMEREHILDVARFPYLANPDRIPNETQAARIQVIDPAWETIVPAYWRTR